MDKFMQQMREAFANEALWKEFQTGIWDTIYSTVAATLVACVLGIILGIILVAGEEDGVRPLPGPVMKVLNFAINILRSVPFLILMIMVLPLSELLVGTTIGTVASIPPLIIASASFVARLVEASIREVDKGVVEAAQSMGASRLQIVWKVYLPEAVPSLILGASISIITLLDKPSRRRADIKADYSGFEVEDAFVVGYGLDYAEKYRNLPYIGILKPEIYA